MTLSTYLLYLSISIIASISIGPSVLLAASNGLNFGRRKALSGVLGHVSAIVILAVLSATGLGALIMASPTLFTLVKYLGVGYLVYIGIAIWRSKGTWSIQVEHQNVPSGLSLYRKSFLLGISNPKALVFFTALFPQFIDAAQPLLPQFLLLAGTSFCNAFVFTYGYALLGYRFKQVLIPMINKGWLGKLTGSLFIAFASILGTTA